VSAPAPWEVVAVATLTLGAVHSSARRFAAVAFGVGIAVASWFLVGEAAGGSGLQSWVTAIGVLVGWACAVEDIVSRRIPNRLVYPMTVLVYAGLVLASPDRRLPLIAGAAGLLFGVCLLVGAGVLRLGMGDVKLAVPIVALLAWLEVAVFGVAIAVVVQSLWAVAGQQHRGRDETYVVPLAPRCG